MLEVRNISYFYEVKKHFYLPKERVEILKDLSFSLPIGENLLICGESGSGKSTLARILSGMQKAKSGEIFLDGEQILSMRPNEIQYVFQDQKTALNPHKSIRALILDVAKNFNLRVEINALLPTFGLKPHILDLGPRDLSSGEAQRVGLLRALIPCPRILICDEVTASLDLPRAYGMIKILEEYQEKHRVSFIFISHTQELFKSISSKVLELCPIEIF